jgi:hypothetical protein
MTRAEILAAIFSLTNRPDLAGETDTCLAAATLRVHQADYFERDLAEQAVNLGTSAFAFSFDAQATLTRYRNIKYLRAYDNTTGVKGKLLTKIDPENVLDSYGKEKNDVYYIAGNNLVCKSSASLSYLYAGWYQLPIIDPNTYSSWIALTVPHAIIFDAASLVFQMINQQEQSRKFDALVAEQMNMVKQHGLGKGY